MDIRARAAVALGTALASAFLMTGCGDDDKEAGGGDAGTSAAPSADTRTPASGTPSGTQRLTEDQAERRSLIPAAKVPYERAARSASGKVPGGRLVELELDRTAAGGQGRGPVWEGRVAASDGTEHEVDVDAVSGKVVRSRVEADQDGDDKRELTDRLKQAKVTPRQAAKTAQTRTKGTVSAVSLDDDDSGAVVWSVDVVTKNDWNKTTYDVGVRDGKVLRKHMDRD